MTDQLPDPATDPIDPTETSLEAFLSQHTIVNGEFDIVCSCGLVPSDSAELTAHLFNAARSSMYRESAAILQDAAASADEERAAGLQTGFRLMLSRADAAELPEVPEASTGSV